MIYITPREIDNILFTIMFDDVNAKFKTVTMLQRMKKSATYQYYLKEKEKRDAKQKAKIAANQAKKSRQRAGKRNGDITG